MSILRLFLILDLSLISLFLTSSISVSVIFVLVFFIGRQTIKFFKEDGLEKDMLFIYEMSYILSFIYALICFTFMISNDYNYLQSFDGINVYIPYTQELLNTDSLQALINKIYTTSKYSFVGTILIPFVYIGKLSSLMDGELYITIQLVIILFASLTAVIIYRILVCNKIPYKTALIYTMFYIIFSIHFYMSTFIVRDMLISFFYAILIYMSFKPFQLKRILIMAVVVLLIASLRPVSAIFAILYIFLVLFMSINTHKNINIFIFLILFISIIYYINPILSIIEEKVLYYNMKQNVASGGNSTITFFNILPPGISHLIKAFYNQFMPIPSWRGLIEASYRPESYNIMNFPIISATFFRYFMWFTIFIGLTRKKIRLLIINNRILIYNMLIALLYIMVQSNTMGHRRLLAVYPVFFLFSSLIYINLNQMNKKIILVISLIIFIVLQLIII